MRYIFSFLLQLCTFTVAIMISFAAVSQPQNFSLTKLDSQQVVVVVVDEENSVIGKLYTFERSGQADSIDWQRYSIQTDVVVGKKGVAWGIGLHPQQSGIQKREGDGKAPSGIFSLTGAFGYLPKLQTLLPYQSMAKEDYCIDVNQSPFYNQVISTTQYGQSAVEGSSEPMRRDIHLGDQLYKKGIFVAHNPANVAQAGSCIFMHIWRGESQGTAGCTAMAEKQLDRLLSWLNTEKNPIFILMTLADYQQRQKTWQLPAIKVNKSAS
ncbi:L,D-transpeptidase family protein [Thalassotalea ganghwensis]